MVRYVNEAHRVRRSDELWPSFEPWRVDAYFTSYTTMQTLLEGLWMSFSSMGSREVLRCLLCSPPS